MKKPLTPIDQTPCLSTKTKCIMRTCLGTKHGRRLLALLFTPLLLAMLLPPLNVHIIYPAFKDVVVSSLEEDAKRLGYHMLPPALKHSILTTESMTPQLYGNIYKLENDFGLMKMRVFSPLGVILYSTNTAETGKRNSTSYFQDIVAKGNSYSKLVHKDSKTLDGESVKIDVVEIYIPIMNQGRFLGAFELYYDVTNRMLALDELISYSKMAMGSLAFCLILLSLFLLRKEVKHQQEKQRADQLMADVDRITRHDMKSPVLSLLTGINYLEDFTQLNPDQEEMTKEMRRAANSALDMINRSLDLYKMEVGTYIYTPTEVDCIAVVRRVMADLSRYAADSDVKLHFTVNGSMPSSDATFTVQAEEPLCYSLIANLVKNAIEASPKDDVVLITLSDYSHAMLEVHNSGSVPKEIRETFFEKYSTAGKTTGTGLGTYSAYLMTHTMNGTIEMTTSEEAGTTITVEFSNPESEE